MKLKEQTVYIPSIEAIENGIIVNAEYTNVVENFGVREVVYLPQKLQEKQLICLSKEELIELLDKSYEGGFDESGEGWNGEYPLDVKNEELYIQTKEQFINQLIDNTKQ